MFISKTQQTLISAFLMTSCCCCYVSFSRNVLCMWRKPFVVKPIGRRITIFEYINVVFFLTVSTNCGKKEATVDEFCVKVAVFTFVQDYRSLIRNTRFFRTWTSWFRCSGFCFHGYTQINVYHTAFHCCFGFFKYRVIECLPIVHSFWLKNVSVLEHVWCDCA